jgi:2-succinyl-6-hydroxy-2,4-cyclohexadiene-1-carboxylate synthase
MESYPIGSSPEALPARSDGPASAEPLVLLHGFTQTGASWAPLREPLGKTFRLLSPDLPGHGAASRVSADLWQTADLLGATLTRAGAMCATWVGYSMGGRAALHLALAHPGLVSKLVLVSTSAGIEDDQERAARRQRDEALAKRIELGGDEGLGGFLAEWLSQPLFATLPPERAGLNERLANSAAGLASSLRLAGAGAQGPLWHRLPELAARPIPVLLVAGELDSTYRRHAERMAAMIGPSAAVKLIAGAGHACHLERPEAFAQQVLSFCNPGAS